MAATKDGDIFTNYLSSIGRKKIATGLLTFGYRHFKTAEIIKVLPELTNDYENKLPMPEVLKKYSIILWEALMDAVKISICFENYFKAKLILNGFIVHKVDGNKQRDLFLKQKKEPIHVNELTKGDNNTNLLTENLLDSTIDYSVILKNAEYYKHLNISVPLLTFLKEISSERNKLHLVDSLSLTMNKNILNLYSSLIRVAESDLVALQNNLCLELGRPELRLKGN